MPAGMVRQLVKFVGEGPCAHTGTRPDALAPDNVAFSDERLIFKFFIFYFSTTMHRWHMVRQLVSFRGRVALHMRWHQTTLLSLKKD